MTGKLLAAKQPLSDLYVSTATKPESFGQLLTPIINNVLILIGLAALFVIIISGFNYISSGGDKNKISQASANFNYALIGLVLAMAAFLITRILSSATGFDFFSPRVQ